MYVDSICENLTYIEECEEDIAGCKEFGEDFTSLQEEIDLTQKELDEIVSEYGKGIDVKKEFDSVKEYNERIIKLLEEPIYEVSPGVYLTEDEIAAAHEFHMKNSRKDNGKKK